MRGLEEVAVFRLARFQMSQLLRNARKLQEETADLDETLNYLPTCPDAPGRQYLGRRQ
jgi:hypothetical protein